MLDTLARHRIERVRHDTRRRTLTVDTVTRLTPHMLRIGFTGDLADFVSLSADDHVKLFFPVAGEADAMRDYTPRRFDTERGTMTIDFALHDAGVATAWAMVATPGDTLAIGGPRGSAIIPADFDWYWLIGDETALPAIGRWLEEASVLVPVTTFVVVESFADIQAVRSDAAWTPVWVPRDGVSDDAALLQAAMAKHDMPPGDGFVWIAAEASVARAVRGYVLDERRHPREWIKAGGYWVRGKADAHDRMDD
ncbi:siderophore-interacting protein [Sphingomonas bacterium]|uniref:siderophore-interacting protein n=1 Tax=Sphingomonas bacterium TaxID=1895847 RepID=UPI001576163C|nr:siderophore-interacting protein [Sphingomonas bacterium]